MIKKIYLIALLLIIGIQNVSAQDTSKSSIVMDIDSGRILYENNCNEKRLIASTTKIMTAILAIENTSLEEKVTIGEEVLSMYGTNIYIEVGEKMTIRNLLYGLMLRSGNDAAEAIAIYIGGSEENFAKMMNTKANELGMNNTEFNNPHGLDDYTRNYSTAYDMALLSKYVYSNATYVEISQTQKYTTSTQNKSYLWYNRNKLLTTYKYCTGGKNGYTPDAGKTLVSTAEKNNLRLTIVTLNDPNIYDTHEYLYEQTFSKYSNYKIIDKNNFKLENTDYKDTAYIKESFTYPLTLEEKEQVKTKVTLFNKLEVEDVIGYIEIMLNEEKIGKINIYNKITKKEEMSFFSKIKNYLLDILKKLKLGLQNNLNPGPSVPIPLEINKSDSSTL